MPRVKRGTISAKRRRNILSQVKGYRFGRSKKERQAKEAIAHAGAHARAHRRRKKSTQRALWHTRLNAVLREKGTSYSLFMGALKKSGVALDRKVLTTLAKEHPKIFEKILETVK